MGRASYPRTSFRIKNFDELDKFFWIQRGAKSLDERLFQFCDILLAYFSADWYFCKFQFRVPTGRWCNYMVLVNSSFWSVFCCNGNGASINSISDSRLWVPMGFTFNKCTFWIFCRMGFINSIHYWISKHM